MALSGFDPDKAYQEIEQAYANITGAQELNLSAHAGVVAKLAAAWHDLDYWMRSGGYPPAAWGMTLSKRPGA